jgi:hypothetical protein
MLNRLSMASDNLRRYLPVFFSLQAFSITAVAASLACMIAFGMLIKQYSVTEAKGILLIL